jgi:hypothetical protein
MQKAQEELVAEEIETSNDGRNKKEKLKTSNSKRIQKTYDVLGGEENRGVAGIFSNVIED